MIWKLDAIELAKAIRSREVSCKQAVTSCLERLEEVNKAVNAVTVTFAKEALAAADEADLRLRRGEDVGPLHGVPFTVKENVDQVGVATTSGVEAYRKLIADQDSPPVANLKRAGGIVLGRTNMPPFGWRWHTDCSLWGPTINPWNKKMTAGGSSGGAAASLAAGIAPIALAGDFGGSIRYPAFCCGVAGIRPTLGRVPAYNSTAKDERPLVTQLFSVQGPMARRIRDVRLALSVMAEGDVRDPWWVPAPLNGPRPKRPLRVALTVDPGGQGVDSAVAESIRRAGGALEKAGYLIEETEPPNIQAISELWWRLGWNTTRIVQGPTIRALGDSGVNRALDGFLSLAPESDISTYLSDLSQRTKHLRDWQIFFERYDLVVGPVSTELPLPVDFDIDGKIPYEQLQRAMRLLVTPNVLGLPAAAVPTGLHGEVPTGVQVIGPRFREDLCLDAAEVIEAQCGIATPVNPIS